MSGPPPDYIEVKDRIVQFRDMYPEGTLQADIVAHTDTLIVVKAYAYRTPDDPRPGTGLASEPFPGKTNFTRDSELMNAETSAWGRALIAVGAADAKRGIASANEVRNRQPDKKKPGKKLDLAELDRLIGVAKTAGVDGDFDAMGEWAAQSPENVTAAIAKLLKAIDEKSAA